MLDLTVPSLDLSQGERLISPDYKADFRRQDAEIRGRSSWKLERLQHFEERNDPSRDALRRGDWDAALRLLEEEREGLLESTRQDEERDNPFHRVRVVEEPLTAYVQWELHALRIQAECGRPIRVVDAREVAALEAEGPLPEVVILGGETLYRVHYTHEGVPDGATRFTDRDTIAPWEALIEALYAGGEDVIPYVQRRVEPLPPPRLTGR
ncbi:DUF6879 family protein [Streptomyces radicis]|uniref:DUF6879 domain-containing protein n=1 Tax=Streptomyces radicis TaxID=1750517 RepID=A0A3A9WUA5_9ACTN|nr:DUF6879 family protein [Streptomyces radicis]RKN09687.1 hypothetical protein D7319_11555 [Streptomyces radicis]RKN23325.1 hypothetical protein D7318_12510 [Streptomyces radicis]